MVYYTIEPIGRVFGSFPQEQEGPPAMEQRRFDGGLLELSKDADGYHVSRLISTDPSLYLNPEYSPGAKFQNS